MDNFQELEGTVQLPLAVYEQLRNASLSGEKIVAAKMREINQLSDKLQLYQNDRQFFETLMSVWTKHVMGGKSLDIDLYEKDVRMHADTFNALGLAAEIRVVKNDEGKIFIKPINKIENLNED